jgi:hypothetical protein
MTGPTFPISRRSTRAPAPRRIRCGSDASPLDSSPRRSPPSS